MTPDKVSLSMGSVRETTDIIPVANNILYTDLWIGRDIQQ